MTFSKVLLPFVTGPGKSFPGRGNRKCKIAESRVILQLVTTSKVGRSPQGICPLQAVLLLLSLTRLLPASKVTPKVYYVLRSSSVPGISICTIVEAYNGYYSITYTWSPFHQGEYWLTEIKWFSQGNHLWDLNMNSVIYLKARTLTAWLMRGENVDNCNWTAIKKMFNNKTKPRPSPSPVWI